MTDTLVHPLAEADPNSLTALFDADPSTLSPADFDRLVAEFRSRADAFASEEAKKSAAPKAAKVKAERTTSVKAKAIADKPVEQLSLDDLI